MRHLLLSLLLLLSCLTASAEDFTYEYEGQTLTYTIIDEEAKTCKLKAGGYYDYDDHPGNEVSGDLIIPAEAGGYKVVEISYYAFCTCSSLTSVSIPNSVTSIGSYAFEGCSALTSVTIPNSVTSIGSFAFWNCSTLSSVTIPNSVTSIEHSAFSGCSSLTSVTIPNSVTSIGGFAFGRCSALTKFIFEDGENTLAIGGVLFEINSLEEVYLGRTLSTNNAPFRNQSKLKKITIGNSVTEIGSSAFRDCSTLTSIIIPNSVTKIGVYAFEGCNALTKVVFEDGENTLKVEGKTCLFKDCRLEEVYLGRNLSYEKIYNGNSYSPFCGQSKLEKLTIGKSVTTIDEYTFDGCSALTQVILEDGENTLTIYIENENLFKDSPLEEVYLGRNLSCISYNTPFDSPFCDQSKLKKLTIGNSVTEIGYCAFSRCSTLSSVTIPNSVTTIGSYAFAYCGALTTITIPNSVNFIRNSAFEGCSALTSVTIGNCVKSIGMSAFSRCSSLSSVNIPNSVTEIEYYAFSGCSALTSVTIGNSVKSIGVSAFSGCSLLTSVTIPNSVTLIGSSAFEGCGNINNIYIWGDARLGDNVFDFVEMKQCNLIIKNKDFILDIPNSGWKDFDKVFYEDDDNHKYIPLIFIGTGQLSCPDAVYTSRKGCLIDANREETPIYNKTGTLFKTYYNEEEISESLMQESGYTYNPNQLWKNNLFYIFADNGGISRAVSMKNAGDLFDELGVQNIQTIEYLSISGEINGTDVMTINRMTSLKKLDISEAKIVEGGMTYRENLKTNNDEIGNYFFYGIDKLDYILLPKSAKKIGNYALSNKSKLKRVFIPQSVISIGISVFDGCDSITNVVFEDGERILYIGGYELFSDSPLEEVYLGRTLSYYSDYSPFCDQSKLEKLTIGNSVTSIGKAAFSGCSALTSVTIGNRVKSIGSNAFSGCSSLSKVDISDIAAWCNIEYGLWNGSGNPLYYAHDLYLNGEKVEKLVIPDGVTSIGEYAFENCSALTSVTIPNSVTSIGWSAFYGCSGLTSVTIGNSVESIGDNAFNNCSAIEEILSLNPTPPAISTSVFSGVDKENCKLLVTKGNLVYYWLDPVWKEFLNISDDLLALNMLPNVKYGDAPVDLAEYAPQGYALKYESTNDKVARLDGTVLTICGAGEATIVASFPEEGSTMRLVGQMRQFIVDKADLTISAPNYTREYGTANPEIKFAYDGFVYDDDEAALDMMPTVVIEADENSEVGVYDIVISGAESQNYNISYKKAKLTIVPAGSSINTINNETIKFHVENKTLVVEGAEGKDVQVFTLNGLMIFNGKEYRIPLNAGVYIVKIGNKRIKVRI